MCNFVFISKVPHHAKGTLLQKVQGGGAVNPWTTLWTTIFIQTQHTLDNIGRHTGSWDHGGCTCSSPRLPSPSWSCHCLPCAPRVERAHTPMHSFCIIPWEVHSLGHWFTELQAKQPSKNQCKDKNFTGISSDLKVTYKSHETDVSLNTAVMFTWLQTFKQEAPHPKTGHLILYTDTQTDK